MKFKTFNYVSLMQVVLCKRRPHFILDKGLKYVVEVLHIISRVARTHYGRVSDLNPGKVRLYVQNVL